MSYCGFCGKELVVASSVSLGYGPECAKLLHLKAKNSINSGEVLNSQATLDDIKNFRNEFLEESFISSSLNSYLKENGCQTHERIKAVTSINRKITIDRLLNGTLNDVDDVAGYRIVVPTFKQIFLVSRKIMQELNVVAGKDFIKTPTYAGYSAIHIFPEKNGKVAEVQIKTQLMDEFAGFMHDKIYKNKELGKKESVRRYTKDMNKHILSIEQNSPDIFPKPEPPKELKDLGIVFDPGHAGIVFSGVKK